MSSCAQTRKTLHPARRSAVRCRVSRPMLASSFAFHQSAFRFGQVACFGHACQKQPSTKTASRARARTKSTVTRAGWISRALWVLQRTPSRLSAAARRSSGEVPVARFARIDFLTAGVDAHEIRAASAGATARSCTKASWVRRFRSAWPRRCDVGRRSRTSRGRTVSARPRAG